MQCTQEEGLSGLLEKSIEMQCWVVYRESIIIDPDAMLLITLILSIMVL